MKSRTRNCLVVAATLLASASANVQTTRLRSFAAQQQQQQDNESSNNYRLDTLVELSQDNRLVISGPAEVATSGVVSIEGDDENSTPPPYMVCQDSLRLYGLLSLHLPAVHHDDTTAVSPLIQVHDELIVHSSARLAIEASHIAEPVILDLISFDSLWSIFHPHQVIVMGLASHLVAEVIPTEHALQLWVHPAAPTGATRATPPTSTDDGVYIYQDSSQQETNRRYYFL